jgi:hypothetical protein
MKHRHAESIMAFAVEAQTSETPWDIFEWSVSGIWGFCSGEPLWEGPCNYRLKPKTKMIDWSKVNYDIVPSNFWGDIHYTYENQPYSKGRTLVTGKRIAWTGGECPLPEGVMVRVGLRGMDEEHCASEKLSWNHRGWRSDIIWFEVTGLADGYEWGDV